MSLVASSNAHCTATTIVSELAGVAEIPVLLSELLLSVGVGADLLRSLHVLQVVLFSI